MIGRGAEPGLFQFCKYAKNHDPILATLWTAAPAVSVAPPGSKDEQKDLCHSASRERYNEMQTIGFWIHFQPIQVFQPSFQNILQNLLKV